MNKQDKKEKLIDTVHGGYPKGRKDKGGKIYVVEGDLTLGSKHRMQYTDDVLQNCTFETYRILLPNVTAMSLIKKKKL